mgnify:CR=1 FL=1
MPSNALPIVQQVQHDFQTLLAYITGPEAQTQTAYSVELTVFRRLLSLGAALLRLFFLIRAAERPGAPTASDGTLLAYHDQRPISYYSIFGKLSLQRHYFVAPGHDGCCPLDAALSLPQRCTAKSTIALMSSCEPASAASVCSFSSRTGARSVSVARKGAPA